MKFEKRMLTILTIFILLLSTFAALSKNSIRKVNASDGAELTGVILDRGIDTDGDSKYDYLEVAVGISVSSEGYYRVETSNLITPQNYTYYLWSNKDGYLSVGLQWLNLSFFGPKIYADRVNISAIGQTTLYNNYGTWLDSISYVSFSKVYNYTNFDCRATLTGNIHDKGIDTDGDGLFNSLQIGVDINVTDPAPYEISVQYLYGTVWVYISNYSDIFLYPGIQTVNVSLNGAKIHASHGNVSGVSYIQLFVYDEESYSYYTIGYMSSISLNKAYSYAEFDPYAFFTGTILDEGVDEDHDGLYDYLKISVEVNVTDAGRYEIDLNNLVGNHSDYVYEYQYVQDEFEIGVYFMNLTVYGPKIYGVHVNPVYVHDLGLQYAVPMGQYSWEWVPLEQRSMMQLPVLYNYSQFESHAFLTGKIYDRGVDSDGDGLFDYLEVGLEVNVTEAGKYGVSMEYLTEDGNNLSYYQYFENDLSVGIHVINFTFPGPMIAYYHINPTNVSHITLTEPEPPHQLSYFNTIALSTQYNYTQFNAPSRDMQIEFTVYPNATVGVRGLFNYTHQYSPDSYQPLVNATLGFSTSDDTTTGSANGTIVLPQYLEYPYYLDSHEFPLNSTTVNLASEYNNGMLNANLDATMQLPPEGHTTYPFNSSDLSLHGAYSDGMLNINLYGETTLPSFIASMFPLNVTDVTVMADYGDNELKGNVTFHTPLSSFPLGDVIVNFSGNQTEITFTGYTNVIYGNWFGMEINQTSLEEMLYEYNSTIPGHGAGSLYNMTMGMVECTTLNTTMTPFGPLEGATVNYTATIRGNFTRLLAYALESEIAGPYATEETISLIDAAINATLSSVDHASLVFNYNNGLKMGFLNLTLTDNVKALWSNALQMIPAKVPIEYRNQTEAFLKIANITADAVENANLDVNYSGDTQQVTIHASLTANVTKMKDEIIPILPDMIPTEYRDLVESCTNTTYCTLDSLNVTCNYVNGVIDFDAKWLLEGDLTAQISHIKSCYLQYLNLTSPWMINWQMQMLNATEIDVGNLKTEVRMSKDWMTLTFEGIKLRSVKDEIDSVRFKLYRLFNVTSGGYESPQEFEKLKLTIIGGSNATHTILLYMPTSPSPDDTSPDYKVMTWQNTSLSSIKDLRFHIAYQEVIPYFGNTYYVPIFTNSTLSNFNYDFSKTSAPSISFNVSGTTGMGFCNITIPRALIDAAMGNWTVKIDRITLPPENYTVTENSAYAFIFLNYTHSSHTVEIVGTWLVSEFPQNMYLPILMTLSFIAAMVAIKQRKKLGKVKAKYQSAIQTFAKILHQLRA
jgi:hypothetical protein